MLFIQLILLIYVAMAVKSYTVQNLFYLWSASELTKLAAAASGKPRRIRALRQPPLVLGAVTASVAFLECSINGLFAHAASRIGRKSNYRQLLASIYHDKLKFANLPWLTKYQVALALAHRATFDLAAEPYQSAELLNQLRNELMHPKEIYSGLADDINEIKEDTPPTALERRLRGKFEFNPEQPHSHEFIPHRCLNSACALWSVRTAAQFYIEFESRLPAKAYLTQEAKRCASIVSELNGL